ncbi:hypothetical protein, partial [Candidatus Protochlamydia sp. W-9]|uniref:hypothetical protein n=1 Tax=Candidatus Protochlamydia sp. W-9 TaxID=1785087 RepID=UPI001D0463FD
WYCTQECGRVGRRQTFLFGLKTPRFKALFFAPFLSFVFRLPCQPLVIYPDIPNKATRENEYKVVKYLKVAILYYQKVFNLESNHLKAIKKFSILKMYTINFTYKSVLL